MITRLFYRFVLILCAFSLALGAVDTSLLQEKDVHRVMGQIFEQHVEKKEMTATILKNSFKVYIDQFDPDRTYLLEHEVKPFLEMDDASLLQLMNQYRSGQYLEYKKLNDVIQNAIMRARRIRSSIEENQFSHLFQKSGSYPSNGLDQWKDPDLKKSFAKNEKELDRRIKQELIHFIASERKRFGNAYVLDREKQTIRVFEQVTQDHENPYLFVNENGQYLGEAQKENLFTLHILKALARSLDAHTKVLNPAEAYDMRIRLEKEMQGIGVVLHPTKDGLAIVQLVKDGPAAKSGLVRVDDRLTAVDGVEVSHMPISRVMALLRGKIGSKVTLVLKRVAEERGRLVEKTVTVPLIREGIAINDDRAQSSYEFFDGGVIGRIKLDSFYQGESGITSENDVKEAIKELDSRGNLRGLILDLRENSGGFLSQAVKVAGLFITNGVVVVSKYFNGEEHFYRDMDNKVAYDGPLIVLTSKATASAAEIVAQALQDYGVAIVVGDEQTYGKGTIQSQTITDGDASAFFKVTVGKYYTVSGRTPQIQGVRADIIVPSQFWHENIGEEYLDSALGQDTISPAYEDALADIAPNLKPWYWRYYAPTLQRKEVFWQDALPELKKKSAERMSRNQDYQAFLNNSFRRPFDVSELQEAEAMAILKDMSTLQSRLRGNESDFKQTAGIIPDQPQ